MHSLGHGNLNLPPLSLVALIPAVAAVLASPAGAQWRVDVSGGAFVAPSRVQFSEQHFPAGEFQELPLWSSISAKFDTGGSYALGAGYAITDRIELLGQFQHSLSRDIRALRFEARSGLVAQSSNLTARADLDVFSLTGGARLHLLPSGQRLRPWLVGQMGWYRATAELKDPICEGGRIYCGPSVARYNGSSDGFGVQGGGGFDYAVSGLVSVGVDVRYHKAFDLIGGLHFVTTMATVGIHF